MQDTQSKIIELIRQNGLTVYELVPTARLREDFMLDSMDVLELTMSLESEFNIEIDDEVFDRWQTLQDVFDTVAELSEKRAA